MSATTVATRDVETSLTYFNYQSEKSLEIDFTKPGSDVSYGNLQKLSESYKVTVHDARGKEDQFSLEKNGFVYAKHDMDAQLAACKTEEEVKDLLVPATEQLVKDVYVIETSTFTYAPLCYRLQSHYLLMSDKKCTDGICCLF